MKYRTIVFALALAGCSSVQERAALDSREILAEAGFRREPLTEPGLPERQLVASGGAYKFADQKFCGCVYVGGAKEYAALEKLRTQRIAEREWIMSRGPSYVAAADRTAWSAWKPEGLELMPVPVAGRPASGQEAYAQRCRTCHGGTAAADTPLGPSLAGVVGAKAGRAGPGVHSRALMDSGIVWDRESLRRFLADPRSAIPGTIMPVGVADPQELESLLDYLETLR